MQNAGIAVNGRGLDLNDAFGNIGPFSADASDVLGDPAPARSSRCARWSTTRATCSRRSPPATRRWPGAIVGANRTFGALASQTRRWPTPSRSSRPSRTRAALTLDRLKGFAEDAGPLFHDLRPVARDLSPTLRDVRRLAPNARQPVQEPRPADQGVRDRPALAAQLPRRAAAGDGQPRPVPRELQPDRPLPRLPGAGRGRLPLQPVLVDVRLPALPAGPGGRRSTSRAR